MDERCATSKTLLRCETCPAVRRSTASGNDGRSSNPPLVRGCLSSIARQVGANHRVNFRRSRQRTLGTGKWPVASVVALVLALPVAAWSQLPADESSNGLGLARLKNYSTYRVSRRNRDARVTTTASASCPAKTCDGRHHRSGNITHLWLTVAQNEFGWPRLLRLRVYYDGRKTRALRMLRSVTSLPSATGQSAT